MRENENKEGTDYGLRFMAEVLKVEHLHWGYFPEKKFTGPGFSMEELRQAQLEYTKRLFAMIPPGVKTILDVGAGLGKTASLLVEKGYQVHCLSNDKYQQMKIHEKYPALPFTKSFFEDSQLGRKFDLALMSESVQYLDWPRALVKLEEVLNPRGYLLMADYFRKSDSPYYRTCKVKGPFREATLQKFDLIKEENITDYVLPTLEMGAYYFSNHLLPAADILVDMIQNKTPGWLRWLANLLLGRQLKKAQYYIWEHTPEKFNSAKFKEKLDYEMILWQKKQ